MGYIKQKINSSIRIVNKKMNTDNTVILAKVNLNFKLCQKS